MEEEPVRIIRESTRNILKFNRQVHKDELIDLGRSIEAVRCVSLASVSIIFIYYLFRYINLPLQFLSAILCHDKSSSEIHFLSTS